MKGGGEFLPDAAPGGRNVHFGVREHGMGAILNGMARHGGVIPYGATFFIFSDYMRPSIRLAALSGCRVVYVLTHDPIGVGEDGPTHQPVEHLASLRAMPNLHVVRPADANETAAAWRMALERTHGSHGAGADAAENSRASAGESSPGRRRVPGRLRAGGCARTAGPTFC